MFDALGITSPNSHAYAEGLARGTGRIGRPARHCASWTATPSRINLPNARSFAAHIVIPLHDFQAGGSERIIIRLANRWAAAGRRVTILCGCEDGPSRREVGSGVVVIRTPRAVRRGLGSRRRLGRAAARMLPSLHADVIVAPGNFHLPVLHAIGRSSVPLVCKLSNTLSRYDDRPLRAALFRWKLQWLSAHLSAVVAISPALAREAAGYLPAVPVHVVAQPNVADDALPGRRRAHREAPHILCAGRLVAQKNLALALNAFACLGIGDAALTIAGDGPERPRLEALARRLGIDRRVRFCGHVPDIGPLLRDSDLLLSTSLFEGYPGVIMEALAAGLPVVTTPSSPAIAEMLDHPTFGRIAPPDPHKLAEAMMAALAMPDPDADRLAVTLDGHRVGRSAEAWLAMLDRIVSAWVPRTG